MYFFLRRGDEKVVLRLLRLLPAVECEEEEPRLSVGGDRLAANDLLLVLEELGVVPSLGYRKFIL